MLDASMCCVITELENDYESKSSPVSRSFNHFVNFG